MKAVLLVIFTIWIIHASGQGSISFSFDDPVAKPRDENWKALNDSILVALSNHHVRSALFVCGYRLENGNGKALIKSWDVDGHMICNHSWSHLFYHSKKNSTQKFVDDFLKNNSLICSYNNYAKFFRFPYLKEGNTLEKREAMRKVMKEKGYRNGCVSIDASDWFIDSEMGNALMKNPDTNLNMFRDFYIQHIFERAQFYDSLATVMLGRKIDHVLLLHHNKLNALFLDDLISYFKQQGWKIKNTAEAYKDPIYMLEPNIIPAGESIVWSMAKETGKYEKILRYPAEDSVYEKEKLLKFIKNYKQ